MKDECGSLDNVLQRKWPVTLYNKGSVGHVQCFMHFDHQKMLDGIAEGVLHLTGHIAICVFQVQCFLQIKKCVVYFNTVLNTTIYNYLQGVYIKSWQHVSVVHSTIIRP